MLVKKASINSQTTCSLLTFLLAVIIAVCPSPSRTFLTLLIKIPLWPPSKNLQSKKPPAIAQSKYSSYLTWAHCNRINSYTQNQRSKACEELLVCSRLPFCLWDCSLSSLPGIHSNVMFKGLTWALKISFPRAYLHAPSAFCF